VTEDSFGRPDPDPASNARRAIVPESAMKAHVIRGLLQVGVATLFIRGGSLIAQFVTGALLAKEDFGLFAVTLFFSTVAVSALSALRPLLIERLTKGDSVDTLWRAGFGLMVFFAGLTMALSGPLSTALDKPGAQPVLLAMAPTIPLQFAMLIGAARLSSQLRFGESSRIFAASATTRHVFTIVFALLGFGPYALVLPIYLEVAVEGTLLWRATGRPPAIFGEIRGLGKRYGSTLPWLGLTAIALAVSLSGDYLAISPFETSEVVGLYFFAYSLSAALTQPFTMIATNVLVPSFASVKDLHRLRSAYLQAISMLLVVTSITFSGVALLGGNVIDFVWGGKWNESIVAMVLISAGTPFRILQPTCFSLLQSRGLWRNHSLLLSLNATLVVGGAALGAWLGGLFEIGLLVGIAGGIAGMITSTLSGRSIGLGPLATLGGLARGAFPAVAGLTVAYLVFPGWLIPIAPSIARASLFSVIAGVLTLILFRTQLREVVTSVRHRKT
jgi:O-antigen/teichoic acid export membrane protein